MKSKFAILAISLVLLLAANLFASGHDRTGVFYVAPRGAITYPSGALADANYTQAAASWRKEGWTFATELGYYLTGTTAFGLDLSFSQFPPKDLGTALDVDLDKSRVVVWRALAFLKYYMVPNGSIRPFIKAGVGFYEMRRYSMPLPETDPLQYEDYSLTTQPAFTGGLGFAWDFSWFLSAEISAESNHLTAVHSSWSTSDGSVGPLQNNLMFFTFYAGLTFHLGGR